MTELELIDKIRNGEKKLFGLIIEKYNQRLFRITRSVTRHDADVDDILKETFLKAFLRLSQYRGDFEFSVWLTRILLNIISVRLNKSTWFSKDFFNAFRKQNIPDIGVSNIGFQAILEKAVDGLPRTLRSVYVMIEVERATAENVALSLEIPEVEVNDRLIRAKAFLNDSLCIDCLNLPDLFIYPTDRSEIVYSEVMEMLDMIR
ncbi:RNA polymerase sigma factor [Sporocytophaga myxococcoides]|uniref:RNA polymerase sigma factor n=1 Tax=Sporocytophaga myxococcoides TaxID=153721 RepID=A0A098LKH5_9BACT|nr:sigma-70 family RNA polymerase sigma factor [Sporocytophaga myxococcoides]GAL86678.1 RNA polymerase sigma factor [Sporocytophaga myxococcoides]